MIFHGRRTIPVLAAVLVLAALQNASGQSVSASPSFFSFEATSDSVSLQGPQAFSIEPVGADKVSFRFVGVHTPNNAGADFVVVSPSSGVAPELLWLGLNPNVVPSLAPGIYYLSLLFTTPGQSEPIDVGMSITLTMYPSAPPAVTSVVSAASLQSAFSPGEIVSIFGANLGTPPVTGQYADTGLFPLTLGNTTVTFKRRSNAVALRESKSDQCRRSL